MLYRMGVLLGITAGILAAADGMKTIQLRAEGNSQLSGNDGSGLRPRDLKQLPSKEFQDLLSKAFSGEQTKELAQRELKLAQQGVHFPETCSIPLLNAKVDHPERFSMPTLRAQRTPTDRMGGSFSPPVCKQ